MKNKKRFCNNKKETSIHNSLETLNNIYYHFTNIPDLREIYEDIGDLDEEIDDHIEEANEND